MPRHLELIQDDAPFRARERDAWFHLLQLLRENDEGTLERASIGRVTFVQLFQQPDQYRGQLVTVRGTLRRTEHLPSPSNDYGFRDYHRVVLQPEDNFRHPIIAYVLEFPEGMPTGMEIEEEVGITGFFFKRWEYEAQRELLIAPVVLAKTVQWMPKPAVTSGRGQRRPSLTIIIAVAAGFTILVSLYVYRRTSSGPAAVRESRAHESQADVGRQMKELAEDEDSSER
jgi:hypothetical protein